MAKDDSNRSGEIIKVSDEQRIVWGWASVITEKGKPVVDLQDDIISPEVMTKAVNDFMLNLRTGKAMHDGDPVGVILHSFPLTDELAKHFGITCDKQGWIIAMKVLDDDVWADVKKGEFKGFSIGGFAVKEEVDEA